MLTKDFILKNAKVLLISPSKKDYDAMKSYGFQRIKWYVSILDASNKFQAYPKDLSRYDIIVERNVFLRRAGAIALYHLFWELDKEKVVRVILDSEFFYDKKRDVDIEKLVCILEGENCKDVSYSTVFSKIVSQVQTKRLEIKESLNSTTTNNSNNFLTPKDIKILCFYTACDKPEVEGFRKAAKNLGMSVVFQEVGKDSKKAIQKIPLYDIVFASKSLTYLYPLSSNTKMNSKGKTVDIQILVTYQNGAIPLNESHSVAGYFIQLETIYKKENSIVRKKEEYRLTSCDDFYKSKSILSSIMAQYQSFKQKEDEPILKNFDFLPSSSYELEYIQKEKEKREEQKEICKILQNYSQLVVLLGDYFKYRVARYVTSEPYGLKIQKLEEKNAYYIETLYNGKACGAITLFPNMIGYFTVQLGTKVEGMLRDEEMVAFVASSNNQMKNPDDKQKKLFCSIYQKAIRILEPAIEKAKTKQKDFSSSEMQRKRKRELKRK